MAITQVTADVIKDGTITAAKLAAGVGEGGTNWQSAIKTSNFTATAGEGYFVNTTSGAVTVSLPAGSAGDEIHFTDYASTFDTNDIIFDANGSQKILGATSLKVSQVEDATVRLIYQDDIKGWTGNGLGPQTRSVDFLVVAGGGGAGTGGNQYGGGGGGGGFRSSADGNGGGQASDATALLIPGTNYTVTVGGGGADGASSTADAGSNGEDSVFANITSKGGGGGGRSANGTVGTGLTGGSGGGGGGSYAAVQDPSNNGGPVETSPVVAGFAGGDGAYNGANGGGGGGGGAGGVGGDAPVSGGSGGNGGPAKSSSITGSAVYYAAGGGGEKGYPGSNGTAGANARGLPNSGDGGTSGDGHSGIVILKYLDSLTLTIGSGLSSTTADSGGYSVTTFTGGTGLISIN